MRCEADRPLPEIITTRPRLAFLAADLRGYIEEDGMPIELLQIGAE